ncbi:hypothetical protein [Methanoregula sp.]
MTLLPEYRSSLLSGFSPRRSRVPEPLPATLMSHKIQSTGHG